MQFEELVEKIEADDDFLRKVAQLYLRFGDFYSVEVELDVEPGAFIKVMRELPELRERISNAIDTEFVEEQRIASKARIRKALNRLSVSMETMDDEATALKAALGILQFDTKLFKDERRDDEDDLDKLWREVTGELKAEKNTKDSKGDK